MHGMYTTSIETDSKYGEMRGQIDFLNDAIEKLGQKMNTQLQLKNDELEQMKTKLSVANSNVEQLSSSNSQLQQQCAYAYNEYRNLEQSKMIIVQEREMLMLEVQQAKQMIAQNQSKESELLQQYEQLRSQSQQSIEDLTAKNYECSSRVEQISVEYNALMLENMNLKKQTAELSKLVPTLESKVENLQFSNRQLQSAQEELSAKYQQQLMSTGTTINIGFQQQQQQHRG